MAVVLSVSMLACGNNDTSPNNKETTETEYSYTPPVEVEDTLTDAEIEDIVVRALYNKISSKYDTADAGSSRYSINKIEEKYGDIYVYGSVTLYDKYGQPTTGWNDGSGSIFRSFTVKINSSGSLRSCDIE